MTTYDGDGVVVPLAEYAAAVGKSLRAVQRWIAAGELPGAYKDDDGRWWVPVAARRAPSPDGAAVAPRRTTSHDVVAAPPSAVPAVGPLGMLGSLAEAAQALGTTVGGVRRLARDGHLTVGPYGPNGALRVYLPGGTSSS